jgi:F-type H+/Na+-transporting ATPase subunit alpha
MADIKSTDLVSLFQEALEGHEPHDFEEIGIVIEIGDFICKIHGLKSVVYGELITFEGGNQGIVLGLEQDLVYAFLLDAQIPVEELEIAKRTGNVFKVPVGPKLAGRILNARGEPIDGLGALDYEELKPTEAEIPGIIERSPVNQSLETGMLVVDALVPIGKGQRELIIGDRSTGKTSLALETIIHQKNKNVYCIYVSIGQRQANVARIAQLLQEQGALHYTIIVSADASEPALNRYLAPYVGCTMGEYFRDKGLDALIVYDDLSNHAVAYREMSLLMRRPPGREAYPGDVFYLHSRLLERAGKLAQGGTLTALPIVQIQAGDITAYIPTNLISITDGQIFLDNQLFKSGVRPAVNVELSVSRVGGAAQTKAIKQMTRALRLELAQYHDLLAFAQFGTELDIISQKRLERGAVIVNLLKQGQLETYSFVDQTLMFYLLKENYLDTVPLAQVHDRAVQFASYVRSVYPEVYEAIKTSQEVSDENMVKLKEIADEFAKIFGGT